MDKGPTRAPPILELIPPGPEKGSRGEGRRTGDGQCHREAGSGISSARACLDLDDGAEAPGTPGRPPGRHFGGVVRGARMPGWELSLAERQDLELEGTST